MRSFRAISTGVVLLLFGAIATAPAQQSQEPKPKQGQQDRDRRKQQDPKPTPPGLQSREQQQERRRVEEKDQRAEWRKHRAHSWQSEHRNWKQRGGYDGFRIPDSRFRSAFGREHWFRMHRVPMVLYRGYPRFQYNGYWFRLVDPWPESWSDDWYQNDDVYIDYTDDGYYLYNRRYPRAPIAVRVYVE